MICAICRQPLSFRVYRLPLIQAPRFIDGWLDLEHTLGEPLVGVVDLCEHCGWRVRGGWRDAKTGDLVVRLTSA